MPEPSTVFLSYAREDRPRVEQVYDDLEAAGLDPWLDSRDIRPGQPWSSVIGEAIRSADFVLVFLSRHSISKRGYFQREIQSALEVLSSMPEGSTYLIPVRLDDSPPPKLLAPLQFVDLFEASGPQTLLAALSIGQEPGRVESQGLGSLRDEIARAESREERAQRPHVFVAMPFAVEMEDLFHYGINRAVDANGFDALRVDRSAFTGDVLEEIKSGIRGSVATVVELTGTNPNVHVELGYAWGCGVPTILLLKEGETPCFDVRGQKHLPYRTIKEVETKLTDELRRLKNNGSIGRG